MSSRPTRTRLARTLVGLSALAAVLAFSAAAPAEPQTSKAAVPCGGVAKGAPWTYKGQKGNAYSVVGISGSVLRDRPQVPAEMDA